MSRTLILLFSFLFTQIFIAQEGPILVFDLQSGTMDSIPINDFDTAIVAAHTAYSLGELDAEVAWLEQTAPVNNTFPGTEFTYKVPVSEYYDIHRYPIRTSVKLFSIQNDTLYGLCSGSLISRRHVLTAAHCVSHINGDSLHQDSIVVAPVFDQGEFSSIFDSTRVSKVYFLKNWSIGSSDFALLELKEDIGATTGWLSVGFDQDDASLTQGIFYKFSYPAITLLPIDSNAYNGDTLYFNYGVVDYLAPGIMGVNTASGIPGESGSPLIKVVNNEQYTVHGVLSLSYNLSHTRINNAQFFAISQIIAEAITELPVDRSESISVRVYPNPTKDRCYIQQDGEEQIRRAELLDHQGRVLSIAHLEDLHSGIDVSRLSSGIYLLRLHGQREVLTVRIAVE